MSANVFLENPWRWRGISDWNDAPGYEIAEHLFLAQCKKTQTPNNKNPKDPQEHGSLFNFWVPPVYKACCWNSEDFFFYASLLKIATFLYRLRNKPALLFLCAKGCHDTTDGIEGWPSRNNSCKTQKVVGGEVIFGRLFGLVTWGFLCSNADL